MAETFARACAAQVREVVVAEGRHPVPDAASALAGARALALAASSRARNELLVVLLSGGGSAMLAAPADGLTIDDKARVTALLLQSGLAIAEVNAVRKHISAIKGGRLAAAAGRSLTFAISDVHGPVEDDPAVIASGPTVADPSTFTDALGALASGGLMDAVPATVRDRLLRGARGELSETIKPGDPRLADARFVLAGSRRDALDGACAEAFARGYLVHRITAATVGESAAAARAFVARGGALACERGRPLCVVAAGETTVTLSLGGDAGVGGRNQEFALAAALASRSNPATWVLASAGTDGIDGPTDAAGAFVDATTMTRALAGGLDAERALRCHDAYPFFRALGDLLVTGPTLTNVGDLQIVLYP